MQKYLDFIQQEFHGKTQLFLVQNKTGEPLGSVLYYPQWRRYVFSPLSGILFDSECLNEITIFINKLMLERKLDQQNKQVKEF